jgi:hypothetical protein
MDVVCSTSNARWIARPFSHSTSICSGPDRRLVVLEGQAVQQNDVVVLQRRVDPPPVAPRGPDLHPHRGPDGGDERLDAPVRQSWTEVLGSVIIRAYGQPTSRTETDHGSSEENR